MRCWMTLHNKNTKCYDTHALCESLHFTVLHSTSLLWLWAAWHNPWTHPSKTGREIFWNQLSEVFHNESSPQFTNQTSQSIIPCDLQWTFARVLSWMKWSCINQSCCQWSPYKWGVWHHDHPWTWTWRDFIYICRNQNPEPELELPLLLSIGITRDLSPWISPNQRHKTEPAAT